MPQLSAGPLGGGKNNRGNMEQDSTKPKNKWKWAFYILLIVLIISNVLLFYGIVDQAVTITYIQQGMQSTEDDLLVLKNLIPQLTRDQNKKDICFLLRKSNPKSFIVETDSTISVGQVKFIFDTNNKLISISNY